MILLAAPYLKQIVFFKKKVSPLNIQKINEENYFNINFTFIKKP